MFFSSIITCQCDFIILSCIFQAHSTHIFPIFAGFRGGKGVATMLGAITGIQPNVALLCFAVWFVPVRMGNVLVRSFFIAHAAPTHQTAMRRTMRRTQPVRPRPHILGPQFPQNLPVTGQGLRKNPWALTPRPAPQKYNIRPYWHAPLFFGAAWRGMPTWPNIGGQGGGWRPRIGGLP